jgi:hypothetical protein
MIRFEAPLLLFCLLLPLLLLLAASRRSGTPMGSSLLSLWREQPDSGPSAPRRWHAPPIALLLLCGALCAAVLALTGPHRSADAAVRITVLLDDSPSMQLEQRQVRLMKRIEEWARANGVLLEWRREAQPDWAAHDSAECLWAADALECRPERAGLVLSGARCVPGAVGREGADRLIYDGRELLREKGAYPPERRSVRVRGAMPAALQPLWAIWCEKQALVVNAAAREPLLELVFPAAVCAADREWIGPGFAARVGLAERPGTGSGAAVEPASGRDGPRFSVERGRIESDLCALEWRGAPAAETGVFFASLWEEALLDPLDCVPLAERLQSGAELTAWPSTKQEGLRDSWVAECVWAALLLALAAWGLKPR